MAAPIWSAFQGSRHRARARGPLVGHYVRYTRLCGFRKIPLDQESGLQCRFNMRRSFRSRHVRLVQNEARAPFETRLHQQSFPRGRAQHVAIDPNVRIDKPGFEKCRLSRGGQADEYDTHGHSIAPLFASFRTFGVVHSAHHATREGFWQPVTDNPLSPVRIPMYGRQIPSSLKKRLLWSRVFFTIASSRWLQSLCSWPVVSN